MKTIAIIGASGFIGKNLIKKILKDTDHNIVALSKNAEEVNIKNPRLKKINVNVFDTEKLKRSIKDCDVAYFLIHMMIRKTDFADAEEKAAESFCKAVNGTKIKRVIYLGGLGKDNDNLSKHLKSRHYTGEILRANLPLVIEFRASIIIGKGGLSYDIIIRLIRKLPILALPKWTSTLTQPIGLDDALNYLVSAIELSIKQHKIVEIGGPEKLSYEDLLKRYSKWKNKSVLLIRVPFIPASVAGWWFNIFTTKKEAKVGRIMVDSLANEMVVTNREAVKLFPQINPKSLEEVFV